MPGFILHPTIRMKMEQKSVETHLMTEEIGNEAGIQLPEGGSPTEQGCHIYSSARC